MAEKATKTIVVKLGYGEQGQESLEREFDFYMHDLYNLQGEVIPRCGGMYRGRVNGMPLGCLLLQFCSGPPIADNEEFLCVLFSSMT